MELVNNGPAVLDETDRIFCYENIQPAALADVTAASAFFTPWEMMLDFNQMTQESRRRQLRILDLCAGIGGLSYSHYHFYEKDLPKPSFVCVEKNPIFAAVGKRLFPEATWLVQDVFELDESLGKFDQFYSNPPFGPLPKEHRVKGDTKCFQYAVAEIGMKFAPHGLLFTVGTILNWRMHGQNGRTVKPNPVYEDWSKKSGIELRENPGFDFSYIDFTDTKVGVELAWVVPRGYEE